MKKLYFLLCVVMMVAVAVPSSGQKRDKKKNKKSTPVQTVDISGLLERMNLNYEDENVNKFLRFYSYGIQENIYVKTDKPFYSTGEKLWFSGFLVNAFTLLPSPLSKFAYFELISPENRLVERVKVKADSLGMFHNCFDLPADMPPGKYNLRAYTLWMTNLSPELFYQREVLIGNPIDDRMNVTTEFDTSKEGSITIKANFRNAANLPFGRNRITYTIAADGKTNNGTGRTDEFGNYQFTIPVPADDKPAQLVLTLTEGDLSYNQRIELPALTDDYDVQFLPEGGQFIPGFLQTVAFRAVGKNGLPLTVSGKATSSNGHVTDFESIHDGMGYFVVIPDPGETIRIETVNERGLKKNWELKTDEQGATLRVQRREGMVLTELYCKGVDPGDISMIIHTRGTVVAAADFSADVPYKFVPDSLLLPGISHLVLYHKPSEKVIAERLVFIRPHDKLQCTVSTDKDRYGRREKAKININVSGEGMPIPGSRLAVSVTDSRTVPGQGRYAHIESWFLLNSMLKGHIYNPDYYFESDDPETNEKLDLVMLTHGWSRFDVRDILSENFTPPTISVEDRLSVSGVVKGFLTSEAKNASLFVMSPETGFELVPLENTGKFRLVGFEIHDTTTLIIQSLSRTGKAGRTELVLDEISYPGPRYFSYRDFRDSSRLDEIPEQYLVQSRNRYFNEGGMRVIDIEAITVTTQRRKNINIPYTPSSMRSYTMENLEQYRGMSMMDVLRMTPGVTIVQGEWGEEVRLQNKEESPLIYYDGFLMDFDYIRYTTVQELYQLDVLLDHEAMMFGIGSQNGVIVIETKWGNGIVDPSRSSISIGRVKGLGYREEAVFYQPKYEQSMHRESAIPDMRTTIGWYPSLVTDQDGNVNFEFYTADQLAEYDLFIEGMSPFGEPFIKLMKVSRK